MDTIAEMIHHIAHMPTRRLFEDKRYYGDSTLYAGMLAYGGDLSAYQYTMHCVSLDGRIWRNPDAQMAQQDTYSRVSTSRDMWMGWLLSQATEIRYWWRDHGLEPVRYLVRNKGKLSAEPDGRTDIRWLGWAYLYLLVQYRIPHRLKEVLPLKYRLLGRALVPFLGIIDLLSCFFVYRHYQINLIYCSLLFRQRVEEPNPINRWLLQKTCWVLRNVRGCKDGVLLYLEGAGKPALEHELQRAAAEYMRGRQEHPTWTKYVWAPGYDSPGYAMEFPHPLYLRWLYNVTTR